MSEGPPRESIRITPDPVVLSLVPGMTTLWRSAVFAQWWFGDATREAVQSGGDARRREILFTVCFAETYLVEWVRDEVLPRRFDALKDHFPLYDTRGVIDRWKDVPKSLRAQGLIPAHPDYGRQTWADFRKLVDYRNGLVHADASRPQADHTPPEAAPSPNPDDLHQIAPGWPTRVVVALVRELHAKVGTQPPKWLSAP